MSRFQPSGRHLGALAGYGAAEPTAESMAVIKVGAKDADTNYAVTALAGNLRSANYAGKNESVLDAVIGGLKSPESKGVFTAGLESQVKKFQSAKGMKADGVVGPKTWKALGLKSEQKAAPAASPTAVAEKKEETKIVETKLTDKVWFWPAVALVGVGGLTTGVIVWKRRRASAS